jgi:hypothetical protein
LAARQPGKGFSHEKHEKTKNTNFMAWLTSARSALQMKALRAEGRAAFRFVLFVAKNYFAAAGTSSI